MATPEQPNGTSTMERIRKPSIEGRPRRKPPAETLVAETFPADLHLPNEIELTQEVPFILPTLPGDSEQPDPEIEKEIIHKIQVFEHAGIIEINDRKIKFASPSNNNLFQLFLYMLRENRELSTREINEWIEKRGLESVASTMVANIRLRIKGDDEPKVLITKRTDNVFTYKIADSKIVFAEEEIDENAQKQATPKRKHRQGEGSSNQHSGLDAKTILLRKLRRQQQPISRFRMQLLSTTEAIDEN